MLEVMGTVVIGECLPWSLGGQVGYPQSPGYAPATRVAGEGDAAQDEGDDDQADGQEGDLGWSHQCTAHVASVQTSDIGP